MIDSPRHSVRCSRIAPLRAAFSLIEIIVVVGLLSVIIFGLLAMFSQTQRIFRAGLAQTDVLEAGRMATDLIARELEQAAPANQSHTKSFPYVGDAVNFYVLLSGFQPTTLHLPGASADRTNLLEDLFFITRNNREWIGIGYFVRTTNPTTGRFDVPLANVNGKDHSTAGTLYRFEASAKPPFSANTIADLYSAFYAAAYQKPNALPVSKITEGVVHFKARAFGTNGAWITQASQVSTNQNNRDVLPPGSAGIPVPDEVGYYYFFSNALPAAVEFELGVLENRTWERFKSLPNGLAQYNYLTNQAGRVHLFRQRVAIHNVDPKAYQ